MRDLLDVIEGNLGGFPYIRAELLDFLPYRLEIWLLLVEQFLEGLRGHTIAPLGKYVGYPGVEL
jgi:hypothetical protein